MSFDPLLSTASAGFPAIRSQPDARSVEEREVDDVARQFTTVLMSLVVKEMFQSTSVGGESDMFGDGPGSDVYRGFAQQAFADAMTKHGMDPLVDAVKDSLSRHHAKAPEDS